MKNSHSCQQFISTQFFGALLIILIISTVPKTSAQSDKSKYDKNGFLTGASHTTVYNARNNEVGPKVIKPFEVWTIHKTLLNSDPFYLSINGIVCGNSTIEVGKNTFEFRDSYIDRNFARNKVELFHISTSGEYISTNLLLSKESYDGGDFFRLNNMTLLIDPSSSTLKLMINGTTFYSTPLAEWGNQQSASHVTFQSGPSASKIYQVLVGKENPYFADIDHDGFDDEIGAAYPTNEAALDDSDKLDQYIEHLELHGPRESTLNLPSPNAG